MLLQPLDSDPANFIVAQSFGLHRDCIGEACPCNKQHRPWEDQPHMTE